MKFRLLTTLYTRGKYENVRRDIIKTFKEQFKKYKNDFTFTTKVDIDIEVVSADKSDTNQ